ncbi:MAG: TetR/AcrR family transcriptional regulator C-terminal domain-containing protein [Anaerolineaceae bacterium]|nr:TetR/AcrR family transcriptional regulator C-terminal domain-containing protein [Anaerolineaceae bacterium]
MNAKDSLKQAFRELLETRPLNRISVVEICEAANVNRQTFYYYFKDIIDLVKASLFEEIADEVARGRAYKTWKHGALITLHYLKEHYHVFLNIYYSSYFAEVNRYFAELNNQLIAGVMDECIQRQNVSIAEGDYQFMQSVYRLIFTGVMTEWLQAGMPDDPEILLKRLEIMLDGSIPRALRAFSKNSIHS